MLAIKSAALAVGLGTLTAVLLGGAALAALAPVTEYVPSALDAAPVTAAPLTAAPANSGGDKLRRILDELVARGVITVAQADAVVAAVRAGEPVRDNAIVKRLFAGLLGESAKYLGLSVAELEMKLRGTTLSAIAETTAGKSRAGLVATLQSAANAAIDKALAEAKLTKEQADKARTSAPAHIEKFVERTHRQAPGKVGQFIGDIYGAARTYLGLSQADLMSALREGKTLGEVAAVVGKSKAELVATIAAAANAKIDEAAADGKLTAEQASALRAQVGPAVTRLVDARLPALKRR